MIYFCTYCDQGYAARMLCLHDSLAAAGEPFRLLALCFDAATAAVIAVANKPSLIAVPLDEVLRADPAYAAVRERRSPVEFYFTTTPVLVRHCFAREPDAERMTYLDADLFFFAPASAVLVEQGDASVGIVPHRFAPHLADRVRYGTYNVAWVSFRRDRDGQACLEWWRERCLEWCYDCLDQGRFADQGYLDEFPRRFGGVRVLDHLGINAAPWNMADKRVAVEGGRVMVNDTPLLFFHFQGIREMTPGWFDPGFKTYETRLTQEIRDLIYLPYLRKLSAAQQYLRTLGLRPNLRHERLNTGSTLHDRWERMKRQCLAPWVRRLRGELVHCAEPPLCR